MAKQTQDQTVLLLIAKVQEKKESIKETENPNWLTNCSLQFEGENRNLRTIQLVPELLSIAAHIKVHEIGFKAACAELEVDTGEYKLFGYSPEKWMSDIRTRLNKLNIDKEKRNLVKLEEKLDKIISPELRAQMEIAAIEKELED